MPALEGLQAELHSEAVSASASRLLVESFSLARVQLLLDLHISEGSHQIPFAVDTHRCVPLSPVDIIKAEGILLILQARSQCTGS